MNNILKFFLFSFFLIFVFAGCSKQPINEIKAAKSAVDAAVADGAEKYAQEEAKKLNDELIAAMDEIKTQESKFIKNYTKAKDMLEKVKMHAEAVKSGLSAKKEEAKKNAFAELESARSLIEETKSLLSKLPPKGKSSKLDFEAVSADLKALEEALLDSQKSADAEDYVAASEKVKAIKEKTSVVTEQIKQTMEKKGLRTQKPEGKK